MLNSASATASPRGMGAYVDQNRGSLECFERREAWFSRSIRCARRDFRAQTTQIGESSLKHRNLVLVIISKRVLTHKIASWAE
jgi:hypothetical protein